MTWDGLPWPEVAVARGGHIGAPAASGLVALPALGSVRTGGATLGPGAIAGQSLALTVRFHLDPLSDEASGPNS